LAVYRKRPAAYRWPVVVSMEDRVTAQEPARRQTAARRRRLVVPGEKWLAVG
jgi:hypothetical protein